MEKVTWTNEEGNVDLMEKVTWTDGEGNGGEGREKWAASVSFRPSDG